MSKARAAATIDRRSTLTGMAGVGMTLFGSGAAAAAAAPGASAPQFGGWSADAQGLHCYVYAGALPVKTVTPSGRQYPLEPDPVFLGNYDLTLFAYASGRLQSVSGERGWVRLNEPMGATPGHGATLTVSEGADTRRYDLLGLDGVCASGRRATRTFGCGAARYLLTPEAGLTVERILSVAPSTAKERAQPALMVTVRLTNTGSTPLDLDYTETILANPTVKQNHTPVSAPHPVSFVNTARLLPGGRGVICEATAKSDDATLLTAIHAPNQYNLYPRF